MHITYRSERIGYRLRTHFCILNSFSCFSLSFCFSPSLSLSLSSIHIHISCLNGIFTSAIQTALQIYLLSSWSNPLYRMIVYRPTLICATTPVYNILSMYISSIYLYIYTYKYNKCNMYLIKV
jgi:hypothetical protein